MAYLAAVVNCALLRKKAKRSAFVRQKNGRASQLPKLAHLFKPAALHQADLISQAKILRNCSAAAVVPGSP